MLKATKENWEQAMNNLINRRTRTTLGTSVEAIRTRDYASHLSKVYVGESLLDVGCGDQFIRKCIDPNVKYYGLDAFPVPGIDIIKGNIESTATVDLFTEEIPIETICAFAVMDGVYDFDKAIENMKLIATKNIIFLTMLDTEANEFHTFKLQIEDYDSRFTGWKKTYFENISTKCYLIEYTK